MKENKMYKCSYKYCKHQDELIEPNKGVRSGSKYYHNNCFSDLETIKQIRNFYFNKVSNTVIMSYLNRVINNIICNKKIEPNFLYFALQYAVEHGYKINSPAALYYLIDNRSIKDIYMRKNQKTTQKTMMVSVDDDFDFSTQIISKPITKNRNFADILRGNDDD